VINFKAAFERHEAPFVHYTVKDVISQEDLRRLNAEVPALDLFRREVKEGAQYRKNYNMWLFDLFKDGVLADRVDEMPAAWRELLEALLSPDFAVWATEGLGTDVSILPLTMGLYRYSDRDYTTADTAKLEKALHWALYLNEDWTAEDGGGLNLWSAKDDEQPATTIIPTGGTMALFAPHAGTWHNIGTITSGGQKERLTIMLEYWKP
jgi:hypothetical protein